MSDHTCLGCALRDRKVESLVGQVEALREIRKALAQQRDGLGILLREYHNTAQAALHIANEVYQSALHSLLQVQGKEPHERPTPVPDSVEMTTAVKMEGSVFEALGASVLESEELGDRIRQLYAGTFNQDQGSSPGGSDGT